MYPIGYNQPRGRFRALPYQTSAGKRPFDEWMEALKSRDAVAAVAIDARLERIRDHGNFGDHKPLGGSVYELRIHLGPGYRIYYLLHGREMVILLAGGLKRDQKRDIARAHEFAADFRRGI